MNNPHSFGVYFLLRKARARNGQIPVYCRITVHGRVVEISTRQTVAMEAWNSAAGRVRGNKTTTFLINETLAEMEARIKNIYWKMIGSGELPTARGIKSTYLGKAENEKTLLELANRCAAEVAGKVALGKRSPKTHEYYVTLSKHLQNYLYKKYKTADVYLSAVNYELMAGFEDYLSERMGHNSVSYQLWRLGKVLKIARAKRWLDRDPFFEFKMLNEESFVYHPSQQVYLLPHELKVIEEKEQVIPRLEVIKDVFVFACWTGFSYAELAKLTSHDVIIGIDREDWIFTHRSKSGEAERVPLLPKAKAIIEKYRNHPHCKNSGKLLPLVQGYHWYNMYLKEVGSFCGLNKGLSTHVARRTFAIKMLMMGMKMESISRWLGHTNILTTQKFYAKILDIKVMADVRELRSKLEAEMRETALPPAAEGGYPVGSAG